jgi:hypothetical protein
MKSRQRTPIVRHTGPRIAGKFLPIGMPVIIFLCMVGAASLAGSPSDVPSVSAGVGPCSADFIVVDAAKKPIYNATIHVKVNFGFMGKRNTDLQIGTNSDGKAHIEGLPNKIKKPLLEYTIQSGDLTKTVSNNPAADCHPYFNVTLQ